MTSSGSAPAGAAPGTLAGRGTGSLSLRRMAEIVGVLARSDLQIRYGRGGMRAVKWFLEPYATVGVFLIVVALVFDTETAAVGLSLACAIVPFQLISATFANGFGAIAMRGSIIVNTDFPRILIPPASLATEAMAFTASVTLIPVMMAIYGIAPTAAVLWLIPGFLLTAALAVALAYPAALFGIWYPEYSPFAGSIMRALFFLAPGLVALEEISGTIRELMPYNPLTGLFEIFRDAVLFGQSPAAWELLSPLAAILVVLALGLPLYLREQAHLAKLVG